MRRHRFLVPILILLVSGCASSALPSSVEVSTTSITSSLMSEISSLTSVSSPSIPPSSSTSSTTSLVTSTSISVTSSATSVISSETSSQTGDLFPVISVASNAPAYYNSIGTSLTGAQLKSALNALIVQNRSTSYDWWRFESADQDLVNTSNVLTIYARITYAKTAHVDNQTPNRWNREHSYPQSKISSPATEDNHHIFADDWKTNSDRGNKLFADLNPASSTRVIDSGGRTTDNYMTGSYFEPNDAAKGEVARATLYLNTLYGYTLENNFQTAELAVLWALYYPVTDWAMTRNNRVYTNQHNRNPYIDNQTYICKVYGNTTTTTAQLCSSYM